MRLFDDANRDYEGTADEGEGFYDYLNRSARPAFARIRETLEGWFSHYPPDGRAELLARFGSNEGSAFFELALCEMLLRLDCGVTLHPDVPGAAGRHPDFLAHSPRCGPFYLEAILSTGESADNVAARRRREAVYNALNRFDSPSFFIGMDVHGAPATPPSARAMRSFLRAKLEGLDPDALGEAMRSGGLRALPRWAYEHDGWHIAFYPIPKGPTLRGREGVRPLGVRFYGVESVDSTGAVRDAVIKKASRYGELHLPYVVAVNVLDDSVDDIDVMQALFGTEQWTVAVGQEGAVDPQMHRLPDGVWRDGNGPRYTRVSAVLIVERLETWNAPRAKARLYHNPWAQRPCRCELRQLPQAVPQDTRMAMVEGRSLGEVLGLPQGWPED